MTKLTISKNIVYSEATDPVTGLSFGMPAGDKLTRPFKKGISGTEVYASADQVTFRLGALAAFDNTLIGDFAFKGKGANKVIDWKRSEINAVISDNGTYGGPGTFGWKAEGFSLSGKEFLALVRQPGIGEVLIDWLTQGDDVVTNAGFGSQMLGGPGADTFVINEANGVERSPGYYIGDFNGLEGDRIVVLDDPSIPGSPSLSALKVETYVPFDVPRTDLSFGWASQDFGEGKVWLERVGAFSPEWISVEGTF